MIFGSDKFSKWSSETLRSTADCISSDQVSSLKLADVFSEISKEYYKQDNAKESYILRNARDYEKISGV